MKIDSVAVIGTGFIGTVHVEAIRRTGKHVKGVLSSSAESSQRAATKLNVATAYMPQMHAAFVVDLFAEAGRNPEIANLVRGVLETGMAGVTDVIARAPEMRDATHGFTPRAVAELILATARGSMMRDVLDHSHIPPEERRERQLAVVRQLWSLLFNHASQPALA